jgi:hypothetical protein
MLVVMVDSSSMSLILPEWIWFSIARITGMLQGLMLVSGMFFHGLQSEAHATPNDGL